MSTENAELVIVPVEELKTEMEIWPMRAAELIVCDQESLEGGSSALQDIKTLIGKINSSCDPAISQAHELHKTLIATKKGHCKELIEAGVAIRDKVNAYLAAEEKKEREAQALEAAVARVEADKIAAEAKVMEDEGEHEIASALRENAEVERIPAAVKPIPKAAGVSRRKRWVAEVTDKRALLEAVLAGTVPMIAIEPNIAFLGKQARALEGEMNYPGVRAWNDAVLTVR